MIEPITLQNLQETIVKNKKNDTQELAESINSALSQLSSPETLLEIYTDKYPQQTLLEVAESFRAKGYEFDIIKSNHSPNDFRLSIGLSEINIEKIRNTIEF